MITIFWFRRDLRLHDNAALFYALKNSKNVRPIFIYDKDILDEIENKTDARVQFINQQIEKLHQQLVAINSDIFTYCGKPIDVFKQLIFEQKINAVYTNHDYEPYAIKRDAEVMQLLNKNSITFKTYKDQCVFEKNEVVKEDGKPYTIFTPYMRRWKLKLNDFFTSEYPTQKYFNSLENVHSNKVLSLAEIGFNESKIEFPTDNFDAQTIIKYAEQRDFPFQKNGTSRLSIHLRFGTISIRSAIKFAQQHNEKWLNELIWRDFYMMILWHFPNVVGGSFKPQYNKIVWRNNESEFKLWCGGNTGYPIVDAGMRQLNKTGFMHNRVRMIVASFLTKHLLIDWRWGEAYFASKLLDFDLSANNGGWQWAAGCGCDAAPYFRIFNPAEQTKKFDAQHEYIKTWVPDYLKNTYPKPIVEHKFARERCLLTYKTALNENIKNTTPETLF